MYLNFFNLNKEPFQITPDPSFLFLSPGHKEALASIIYGVEKKKGFVLIVGAVGVGKTTILRAYLEKAEKEKLVTIYLFNANISYENLLKFMFKELGIIPESDDIYEMVNQLHQALIMEYRQGRNVLLLIDEAQNMPVDTLENLRMLSNLETSTEKLIQIVFSAQPEFEKTLNLEELKQLKQRVAVKAIISPLTREEGLTYIQHRLERAAEKDAAPIFTNYALREIVRCAKGIPRVINVLCDNSLITAFGYGDRKVGLRVVKEITRDFGLQRPFYQRWTVALLLLVLIVGGIFAYRERGVILKLKGRGEALATQPVKRTVPSPAPPPATAPEPGVPAQETGYVERVVERGDTLAKLIAEVYGRVNGRLIRLVKNANPHIDDENLIIEGRRIVFPVAKKK
ncbi:hypothetical protein GMSM_23570 [Geomonas sp. Red276]